MSVRKSWFLVGRNSVLFLDVSVTKFTKFSVYDAEMIAACNAVFRVTIASFQRYSRSEREIARIRAEILMFWAANFLERCPNFWRTLINLGQHRTCGIVCWRSAKQTQRLGSNKKERKFITTAANQNDLWLAQLCRAAIMKRCNQQLNWKLGNHSKPHNVTGVIGIVGGRSFADLILVLRHCRTWLRLSHVHNFSLIEFFIYRHFHGKDATACHVHVFLAGCWHSLPSDILHWNMRPRF